MNPLIGLAAQFLPQILGMVLGKNGAVVSDLIADVSRKVLGTDDAEQAEAIMRADASKAEAFKLALAEATAEFRLSVEDVQSARAQTLQLVQAGSGMAWGPVVVSVLVTLGFLGAVAAAFLLPQDGRDSNLALLLVGSLTAAFGQVVSYYLGSSSGSKAKDEAFRSLLAQTITPTGGQVAASAIKAAAGKVR